MKFRRKHFVNGLFSIYSEILLLDSEILCRLNAKLEAHGYPPMNSLADLSDGVRLIQLMVCRSLFQGIKDNVLTFTTAGNHGSVSLDQ